MRILYILHQFYPEYSGGTEHVALNLAKAAQRSGHHVRVLACTVKSDRCLSQSVTASPEMVQTVYQGLPVTLLPRDRLPAAADISFDSDAGVTRMLAEWMSEESFDVCHVLHSMRMGSALVAVQQCGIPYLFTLTDFFAPCFRINYVTIKDKQCAGSLGGDQCVRDCNVAPWTDDALRNRHRQAYYLLAGAAWLICPSEYVAQHYSKEFPDLVFDVVPHGIDLLAVSEAIPSPRTEVEFVLGFVATMVPQKGLDTLLRAFTSLTEPGLRLLVCGGFVGAPAYEQDLHRLAAGDSRIQFVGQLPPHEVFSLLRSLDVLCLPSRVPETFSLILHEAFAVGVPALVSALGAPAAIVESHGCGRVLPAEQPEIWAEAIAALTPEVLSDWRSCLPLPLRVEEEAFFYESIYRKIRSSA